jgi:hypothetical protein
VAERGPADGVEFVGIEHLAPNIEVPVGLRRFEGLRFIGGKLPSIVGYNSILAPGCKTVGETCNLPMGKFVRCPLRSKSMVE